MKIAVYLRVSTDKQDHDMQRRDIDEWISNHRPDSDVVKFCDVGSGSSTAKRHEFRSMIERIREGEFNALVCYRLDRLSRNSSEAIRLILDLDDLGVEFIAVGQPIFSSDQPFRKAIVAIFAELAQMEREILIERVNAGIRAARERGSIIGRPTVISDDLTAEVLRMRRDHLPFRKIATILGVSVGLVHKIWSVHKPHG